MAITDICESVVDSVAGKSVLQQINSLIRRSLLKKTDGLFCLQPYVLAYVTERFIQQICTEFETQQMDVLQSHSLIGVLAKDWRREIQLRPILQLAIERLLSRFGTVSEIEKVAHKLLKQPTQKPGYLASNLRDILVQLPEMY